MKTILWLTGFSGSGKTTIANSFKVTYREAVTILDGDLIRKGLCSDLGFSDEDRKENIRRIGEVAKFLALETTVVVSIISPFREDRDRIKKSCYESGIKFYEVYIDCPLSVCELRDVKGLYRKARKDPNMQFTGIQSVYEPPKNPDIVLKTHEITVTQAVFILIDALDANIGGRNAI